jgi:hypothetical protein
MKRVICSFIVGLLFLAITCSKGVEPTQTAVNTGDDNAACQSCKGSVSFTKNLSTAELAGLVKENGVEIKEFSYKDGDIVGGYVLQNGESIESAINNFKSKHISFLVEAGGQIATNLAKERDQVAVSGYSALGKKMSSLLEKAKADDINIVSMKVAASSLGKLKGLSVIGDVSIKDETKYGLSKSAEVASTSHEPWAPYYGKSKVTNQMTFQFLYFNYILGFGSTSTYECETQVYNKNFADFDGYWSSNFPNAYYDTPFSDQIDNFTIGSFTARQFTINAMYYAQMTLRPQTAPTATVRIKGQLGHRYPSSCYSTWCVFADATTSSLVTFTAPITNYLEWYY